MAMLWKKSVPPLRRRLLWINHQSRDYCDEVKAAFEGWAIRYGKVYKTLEEKERRFLLFRECFRWVEKHNNSPHSSSKVGLNQFSDYTPAELRSSGGVLPTPYQKLVKKIAW
ncbi:putative actinidain [Helianthus annuus]|nr:putative actinidain [Helianthus annuus]KAJ0699044.1 putative actinidain [Helianthus annuus]KAJ0878001.1 putative actinidain [Helianthus annuus]KAJ0882286.1 putative actinidain [Helianthus annuus]